MFIGYTLKPKFFVQGDYIFKFLNSIFILLTILIIFISIFFIPIVNSTNFIWPIPDYTTISSFFGKRTIPTTGASSFHYGIDIPAPEGIGLLAVHSGEITFANFLGPGGCTITLSFDNYKVTYCHIDPNYIVKKGDFVNQGQIIRICGT